MSSNSIREGLPSASRDCKNHPNVPAVARCEGCHELFCDNCLVTVQDRDYCGDCKVMAVREAPLLEDRLIPCPEAGEALKYAIIGIFCFGIILEPIAISKALKAKKLMEMNPNLTGAGKATAALVIAVVALILWVLGLFVRLSELNGGRF